MSRFFISYRRSDTTEEVNELYKQMVEAYDDNNVFMDTKDIPQGTHFPQYIENEIKSCEVMIAVIGENWLNLLQEKKARSEVDYVELELAKGLSSSIKVIPLLIGNAAFPPSNALPLSIQRLTEQNATTRRIRLEQHLVEDIHNFVSSLKEQFPYSHLPVLDRRFSLHYDYWLTTSNVFRSENRLMILNSTGDTYFRLPIAPIKDSFYLEVEMENVCYKFLPPEFLRDPQIFKPLYKHMAKWQIGGCSIGSIAFGRLETHRRDAQYFHVSFSIDRGAVVLYRTIASDVLRVDEKRTILGSTRITRGRFAIEYSNGLVKAYLIRRDSAIEARGLKNHEKESLLEFVELACFEADLLGQDVGLLAGGGTYGVYFDHLYVLEAAPWK